jgi:hypothetical protein
MRIYIALPAVSLLLSVKGLAQPEDSRNFKQAIEDNSFFAVTFS